MKFSVLMSIYYKEKPEYFDRSLQSVWDEQIVKPDDIILVQDGKLTDDLDKVVAKWKKKIGNIFTIVSLEQNVGLGDALNEGLKYCRYELIARMDTDDIALSERFEKQVKIFENSDIDICSSWVSEFNDDENDIVSYRKLPEYHNDIVRFSKKRNPINHPAVMYRKSKVEQAGGYKKMMWFEDYYLWSRMMLTGVRFYNIQEPLVSMRAGYGQLERRSGLKYAFNEIKFQKRLLGLGFINRFQFMYNSLVRFCVRVLPKNFIRRIYRALRD